MVVPQAEGQRVPATQRFSADGDLKQLLQDTVDNALFRSSFDGEPTGR